MTSNILGKPDGVGVCLRLGEEVNGIADVVNVLVLTRQVVAGRTVTALVCDLRSLVEVVAVAVDSHQGQVVAGHLVVLQS